MFRVSAMLMPCSAMLFSVPVTIDLPAPHSASGADATDTSVVWAALSAGAVGWASCNAVWRSCRWQWHCRRALPRTGLNFGAETVCWPVSRSFVSQTHKTLPEQIVLGFSQRCSWRFRWHCAMGAIGPDVSRQRSVPSCPRVEVIGSWRWGHTVPRNIGIPLPSDAV